MAALTLGSAILGSAIVGSGAAIYAGSQQNKAIKNAANQQAQAAQQSINFAREGRDYAKQVLSKYSVEGDAARSKMNTFLGIKPTASQYSGAMGSVAPTQDFGAYVRNSPDLMAAYQSGSWAPGRGLSMEEFGQKHYAMHGQGEGRELPTSGGAPAPNPTQTDGETQEEAWAAYEQTPWGRLGQLEADTAKDQFTSMAGAQGSSISGRTARGMAEVANEAKLRNFQGYYGALGGVADTGFSADTGIASGGQQFADRAAQITTNNGNAQADLAIAKGQNNANTADDLASWIGWGVGNMPQSSGGAGTGGRSSFTNRAGSSSLGSRVASRIR